MRTSLTPHGPGFSFLDRFIPAANKAGTGWKYLPPESPFFAGHFPGRPVMPAVLLAECAAQAAGAAWMHGGEAGRPLFLAAIDRFRVRCAVAPGSTVRTDVELVRELGPLAQFAVRCFVEETEVAVGQLVLSMGRAEEADSGAEP